MLGIIIKDFYESFCLRKNLIGMIFSFACLAITVVAWNTLYGLILTVVIVMPMVGCSTLQYSMEQDEICNYNKRLLSFPLTRKEIVESKIISTIILSILTNVLFSLPVTLLYSLGYHVTDLSTGMWIWLAGVIVSFIMTPINNIGFFLLGNKRGTIFYIIFLVFIAISYVIANFTIGINELLMISTNVWLLIGIIFAIIINIISYFACIKIYTFKNS